jgi:hypothetical protein
MLRKKYHRHLVPLGRKLPQLVVAIAIALSFIATWSPLAGASSGENETMACCAGKAAGHCDVNLSVKKPPKSATEPMCGLHDAEPADDGITIIAEPSPTESHHSHARTPESSSSSAVKSASLKHPCHMDCGACMVASNRQQARDRGIGQPTVFQNVSLTRGTYYQNESFLFSANENWSQINPRGPPSTSVQ